MRPWCTALHSLSVTFSGDQNMSPEEKAALINSTKSPISFLSKLGQSIAISRKRNPKVRTEINQSNGFYKALFTSAVGKAQWPGLMAHYITVSGLIPFNTDYCVSVMF